MIVTILENCKTGDETELYALLFCAVASLLVLIINAIELAREDRKLVCEIQKEEGCGINVFDKQE